MLVLIRCIACGFPLGDVYDIFARMRAQLTQATLQDRDTDAAFAPVDAGLQIDCSAIFDKLGIKLECCRMHLATGMNFSEYR